VADTLAGPDVVTPPTEAEIFHQPPAAPDTRTRELLAIGIDMITATTDDLAAAVIERLCDRLADVADDLAVTKLLLSRSMELSRTQHLEILRLKRQQADLYEMARGRPR
jgi:hypothetical protein